MNRTSIIYAILSAQLLYSSAIVAVRTIAIPESQADVGGVAACTPIALHAVQKAFTLEFPLWNQGTIREILHAGTAVAQQGSAERNFMCTEVDNFIPDLRRIEELTGNFELRATAPQDPFGRLAFRDALSKLSEGDPQGVRGAGITTGGSTYGLARRGREYMFFNSHVNPAQTPSGASARIFYSYGELLVFLEDFFDTVNSRAEFAITLYDSVAPAPTASTKTSPTALASVAVAPVTPTPAPASVVASPGPSAVSRASQPRRSGAKRKSKKRASRRKKSRKR